MSREFRLKDISEHAERVARYQSGVFALTQFLWENKRMLLDVLPGDYTDFFVAHTWTSEHSKLNPKYVHASLNISRIGNEFGLSVVRTEDDRPGYDVGHAQSLINSREVEYHFLRPSGFFPTMDLSAEAIVGYSGIPFVWANENGKSLSHAMADSYCPSFTPTELAYSIRKQLNVDA